MSPQGWSLGSAVPPVDGAGGGAAGPICFCRARAWGMSVFLPEPTDIPWTIVVVGGLGASTSTVICSSIWGSASPRSRLSWNRSSGSGAVGAADPTSTVREGVGAGSSPAAGR